MTDWKARLAEKKFLVSDGAWGTELARLGMPAGIAPEQLNLDEADLVYQVAASYVEAGADIILSNTFGGSPFKLAKVGLGDSVFEINQIGAALSKKAAGDHALVFASIGPSGEFLEPFGSVSETDMVAAFALQAQGLIAGGADGVVIETMTDLNEALAALKAVKQTADIPVVVSMTFDKGPAGFTTMMGVRPEQAASEAEAAGADLVGSNCGQGIENIIEIARVMRPVTALPLWMKANAGLPEYVDGQTVYRQTPDTMAGHLRALYEAGGAIIGGCCGTTPEHIARVVRERATITG